MRAPINLREFLCDFQSELKEKQELGELINFKKIENFKESKMS